MGTVESDLIGYMHQLDADDAFGEAVEEKLDDWMQDSTRVTEAVDGLLCDGAIMALDFASVLVASEAAFAADASRFFWELQEKVRERMRAEAENAVEDDQEEAAAEAQEARDFQREAWR